MVLAALVLASVVSVRAQTAVAQPFDVVVMKPAAPDQDGRGWDTDENVTKITNYALADLILQAYDLKAKSQLMGLPDWAEKERYDITAKVTPEEMKRMDALPLDDARHAYRATLQMMLAERFHLQVQLTTKSMPRFALERVSPGSMGPGLLPTQAGPDGRPVGGTNTSRQSTSARATLTASGIDMTRLADRLSGMSEVGQRVVVDRTGLTGFFHFTLEYAPDSGMGVSPEATLPGLLDAMREQLGLKLVKDEGEVPVVVVTAVSKPEMD